LTGTLTDVDYSNMIQFEKTNGYNSKTNVTYGWHIQTTVLICKTTTLQTWYGT